MIKIVGIGGSLRPESTSYQALDIAIQRVQALGVNTETLDLRQMQLPFCQGSGDYPDYPDVMRLRETVQNADGLILATPEYHGGVSGVLKNALDLMSFDQLSGKVTGLISVLVSPGKRLMMRASYSMRNSRSVSIASRRV
jgi:FMN reductase